MEEEHKMYEKEGNLIKKKYFVCNECKSPMRYVGSHGCIIEDHRDYLWQCDKCKWIAVSDYTPHSFFDNFLEEYGWKEVAPTNP